MLVITMIENLLAGNEAYRKGDFARNADYYRGLTRGQKPGVLWIGCSDSRVIPEQITSSVAGSIFVHRNIGNIVPVHDYNFATVAEYAIKHLKVGEIVVCGHSECGAIRALDGESKDSYVPLWLNNAMPAKERVDKRISPPVTDADKAKRYRMIEEENVRLQIEHLLTYPMIKSAVSEKKATIHGMYYDLETGVLSRLT